VKAARLNLNLDAVEVFVLIDFLPRRRREIIKKYQQQREN
jgi:hypothetical protein